MMNALKLAIADIFEMDADALEMETPFQSCEHYDSLKVVLLMAALEEDFKLLVEPDQAEALNSLQAIVDYAASQGVHF